MADDLDPAETREWRDSLDAVLAFDGPDRATFLLDELIAGARRSGVPVPYSALITRTPRTPMTNWLKSSPRRLTLVGSKVRRSTSDIEVHRLGIVAPAMTAMPTVRTAMAASVHQVERTLRSLIHSERNTLAVLR